MARGTWSGSGTWQSSGGGAGIAVAVLVLLAIGSGAASAVASALAVILIVVAVVLVLAVTVVVVVLWRRTSAPAWTPVPAVREDRRTLTATAAPQVTQATAPPVIQNHLHIHVADAAQAAALIRTALPGTAGEPSQEEE